MLKEDSSDSRSNQQILEDIDREIVQYIDEAAGIPKGKIKKFMRMKRKEYQDSA